MSYRSRARAKAPSSSRRPAASTAVGCALRGSRGNSLVLMTVCTIGLLVALAFFGLGYVKLLSSNNEQRTAIEASALTAAQDLGKIVIQCHSEGDSARPYYVSLADHTSAPSTPGTDSASQSSRLAHSINSILATIRLDLLIADQVGDAKLKTLIAHDLAFAQATQAELNSALQDAIKASPSRQYADAAGNPVNVYQDALKAYTSNQMRITGSSSYIDASLSLSLGCEPGLATNIPVPSCGAATAQIPEAASQNNLYLAYVDAPFKDTAGSVSHFVFAGVGSTARLCNPKTWAPVVTALPSDVPYLPCIVRAEADQHMNSNESVSGYTVHAVACAQPASTIDPLMTGESSSLGFPVPPAQAGTKGQAEQSSSKTGLAGAASKEKGGQSSSTENDGAFRLALYQWLKRSGCRLDVASAVATISKYSSSGKPPAPPPPPASSTASAPAADPDDQ